MNQAREKQSGFTIMELLLTLLIVGILAGIGLPSFNNLIANNKMSSNANEIVGAFNLARSEAAKQGARINVSSVSGGTDWATGYRVWRDANANAAYDAGEEIRIYEAIDSGLTLTGTVASINFNAVGFASSVMTLTLCSGEAVINDRQLDVALSGRININQFNCP
jgi:type IV fimbrial biogenesis protein FimT